MLPQMAWSAEEEGCLKALTQQLHVWTCGKPLAPAFDGSASPSSESPGTQTQTAVAQAAVADEEASEFHGLNGATDDPLIAQAPGALAQEPPPTELQSAFVLATRRKTVLIGAETLSNPLDFALDVKKAFPKHTHFILQSAESCEFPQAVQSLSKVLRLKTEWGPKRKRYSRQYVSTRALNMHLEESCKGANGKQKPTGIFSSTPMVGDSGTLGFLDPELKSWYYLVRREGRPASVQVDLLNRKDATIFINQRGPGRGLYQDQELDFLAQLHLASEQSRLTLLLPIGIWDPELLGETVDNLVQSELEEALLNDLVNEASVTEVKKASIQ